MSVLEQARASGNATFPTTHDHPSSLTSPPVSINPKLLANPGLPPIDELLYAGFLEHVGRCIYGGIVDDPKNPCAEGNLVKQDKGRLGHRKDVLSVLAKDGELEVPMLRWPGGELAEFSTVNEFADRYPGNYVSNYHWQDGIGPIEDRPKRIELAWLSNESNMSVRLPRPLETPPL
jgi:alpha-N-arabinofuranosidase